MSALFKEFGAAVRDTLDCRYMELLATLNEDDALAVKKEFERLEFLERQGLITIIGGEQQLMEIAALSVACEKLKQYDETVKEIFAEE